jgi:RNA polymerase sigma factor (sigma-70 family)
MKLLPQYFRHVQRILRRRGRTRADAEDLIHDAFIRMQRYCDAGGEVRQPEAFVLRAALNLSLNAQRNAHRELYVEQSVDELTFIVDTNPTPDEVLAGEQCLERMRLALDAVSRRTRDIFFMHRVDGMSYPEISREAGISVSAIEKHMARAIAALTDANLQE